MWQTATFTRDSSDPSRGTCAFSTYLLPGDHTVDISGIDGRGNPATEVSSIPVTITKGGTKAWVIVLIVVVALVVVCAAGYLIWRNRGKIEGKAKEKVGASKQKLNE